MEDGPGTDPATEHLFKTYRLRTELYIIGTPGFTGTDLVLDRIDAPAVFEDNDIGTPGQAETFRPDRQRKLTMLTVTPFRHRYIDTLVRPTAAQRIDVLVPYLLNVNQCALPRTVLVML